jgi:hypothetical protein
VSFLRGLGVVALAAAALLSAPGGARGQVAVNIGGDEGDFEALQRRIVGLVRGIIDYTTDVRLSSEGLEAVLENVGSLATLSSEGGMDSFLERARVDGRYDFDLLVRDPDYVAWSREHELDGAWFFGQVLRLQALRMREESLGGLDDARQDIPEQRALLERMRGEMEKEEYERRLAALDAAAAMVEETAALMEEIPVATPDEAALLESHAQAIRRALEADGTSP